jgi:hypothetical protein
MQSSHYSQFNEYEQLQSEKSMSRIIVTLRTVGGMISSTILTLAAIPAIYALVKEWPLRRRAAKTAGEPHAPDSQTEVAPM